MKVVAVDLGRSKTVVASSDTAAGEVVLTPAGERSIEMVIDYRGKKRIFGGFGNSMKKMEQVTSELVSGFLSLAQSAIRKLGDRSTVEPQAQDISQSDLYSMLVHLVDNYRTKYTVPLKEIQMYAILSPEYGTAVCRFLQDMFAAAGVSLQCLPLKQALAACYLCTRSPERKKTVLFVDVGHSSLGMYLMDISKESIESAATVHAPVFPGRRILEAINSVLYTKVQNMPGVFDSPRDFSVKNRKQIKWINKALGGLHEVSVQVDINHEACAEVHVSRNEVLQASGNLLEEMETQLKSIKNVFRERQAQIQETNGSCNAEEAQSAADCGVEIQMVGGASRLFFVHSLIEKVFGQKPQTHLNPDESAALGGVYRGLMESPFHRLRFDPAVLDTTGEEYFLQIVSSDEKDKKRTIKLFAQGSVFYKDTKSKYAQAVYNKDTKILSTPRKSVKITKVRKDTIITLRCAPDHILARLKVVPPEEKKRREEQGQSKGPAADPEAIEEADTHHEKNKAENKADGKPEGKPEPSLRTVTLVVSLDAYGFVTVSSSDVDVVYTRSLLNFEPLIRKERAALSAEHSIVQAEERLNLTQTRIFEVVEKLTEGKIPIASAQSTADTLMEKLTVMPSSVSSLKEVTNWEADLEKEMEPLLRPEWDALVQSVLVSYQASCPRPIPPAAYPGVLRLYEVEPHIQKVVEKILEETRIQEEKESAEAQALEPQDAQLDGVQQDSLPAETEGLGIQH